MIRNGRLFFLPMLIVSIQSCAIINILHIKNSADVIFTGRVLSIHQWALNQPYSAFVWVFQILHGESYLLEHYQSTHIQRPLYIVVDNLVVCEGNSQLKYHDVKIFGVRITHARFYSSFTPLRVTLANMNVIEVPMSTVSNKAYTVAVEQHNRDKNRKCLRIILILVGIIIALACIFLIIVVYRTLKTGIQRKSVTTLYGNDSESMHNQSLFEFRYERNCQYGRIECEFNATCTEQDECRCIFDCNDDGESVQDERTGITYPNQCRLDQAQCNAYYQQPFARKADSVCSSIICSHGSKCRIDDNGLPRCFCPDNCDEYARTMPSHGYICGSDNKTYESLCELNKKACQIQENLVLSYIGECHDCHHSDCPKNPNKCNPHIQCLFDYHPLCASNLQEYSNECEMNKYACQSNIHLTKLHDGSCDFHEQRQQSEACKALICFHGKTCMIEDGIGVCRCIFNCSSEENKICGSNGMSYRNLCEMQRDHCAREENIVQVDSSHCFQTCDTLRCPYGQCKQRYNEQVECECKQCSTIYSYQDIVCGNNGISYSSQCHLEYDACTRHLDIRPIHMGQCNNCHNVKCPFHGRCQSEQGNYTCVCPSRNTCSPVRYDESYSICASNQQLFASQCEMDIRSCELQIHLYAIAPHYCNKDNDKPDYTRECGYDEPLFDIVQSRTTECDTIGRCPMNSFCNAQTNRCCVKVITAVLPYRMCSTDEHCGKNMVCLSGLCECARQDYIAARKKRECIAVPYLSVGSTCSDSSYGCCNDNITISPSVDRRGCPEYCNCHSTGSLQTSCDPMTNSCYCRPAVGGPNCSHCENEYWGFSRILTHNNTGCTPCGCHPYGSTRKDCVQDTGECSCQSFATGRQCDKCIDSTLKLTERGCVNLYTGRRRPRTCRDLVCLFEGVCQIMNEHPRCTCHHVTCTNDEQRPMDICASDGRTYKSKCAIKRQRCLKQYEIGLIYPGVCADGSSTEYPQFEEDFVIQDEEIAYDYPSPVITADSTHSNLLASNYTLNPVRRTTMGACIRRTPCENHATCIDRPDGNYKCLCAFGWQGRHCNERFDVTIPHFNRQSYFELKTYLSTKSSDNQLLRIDLIFASEHHNGLLLYSDDKLTEFYFIISIRNKILDITVRLDHFISTMQLPDKIELDTYSRLQVHILHNEIRARLNDGNISSRLLPFGSSFKSTLYLGGLPDSLNSLYQQFHLDEGFQGCIHELSINERRLTFNSTDHHIILTAQNIDECIANPCRSGIASCRSGTRCIPIRNNDANSYKCICDDHSSSLNTDCLISSIDRCSLKPCDYDQQCINVYPNNYTCICRNCSADNPYIAAFDTNSYIKRPPLEPLEHTGKFSIEIWFLSESSSGLLIYSDHVNSKKGYFTVYIRRRMVTCNIIMGSKTISLSSRYPIELNIWHRCSIEIHGQKLTLEVDQESPVVTYELFSTNILWPRSFTFIGNLPIQYRSFDILSNSIIVEGFRGAIQKIILNNQLLDDIRQDSIELFNISEYHGYPCHPNPCTLNKICQQTELNNYTCHTRYRLSNIKDVSVELDGKQNLVYSYVPVNLNRNYFKLLFRTTNSYGLIFYMGDTTTNVFSQYLSLTVINGFLQFTVKTDLNSAEVFLRSKSRIDDGHWHRIEIERFRRRITMKLDDSTPRRAATMGKNTAFRPNPTYIYVGGYHRLCGHDEQHCRGYRGCLKNFLIDKYFIDLFNDEINQYSSLKQC
ncbi:unnamed protein product [Rotaria socialis]|uniref:Agrin-like protein n=1 Tax=Rotaria socialis TaxID=392032 RepID=A0A817YGB9_9BILA|nr:unnamed protein product [Rotaria socialis]